MSRACRISMIISLLVVGSTGSVHAKGKTSLSSWVPYEALGLVVVNHQEVSSHPSYADIKKILAEQHVGRGFRALAQLKFLERNQIQKVLSFHVPGLGEGSLIQGSFDAKRVRQHAQAKLADGFWEGMVQKQSCFSLSSELRMCSLPSTGAFVVAPMALVDRVVGLAAGKGKGFEKRSSFKALMRVASKGSPLAWGVSYLSKVQRQRLSARGAKAISQVKRTYFRLAGTERLDVKVKVLTETSEAAKQVADAITHTIRQRIIGTTWMKLLGIAAVAKRIAITTDGSEVQVGLQLTAGQVGLLCKSGSRVIAALRQ